MRGSRARVAVIGAGISGISLCYMLEKVLPQVSIDLFEKDNLLFGKTRTIRKDGFILETGPDCFVREKPLPIQIAEELGFSEDIVGTNEETKGTFIYSGGRLHPLPEGLVSFVPTRIAPFLKTGLISPAGKVRMLADLFLPPGKDEDPTLAEFVRRRLGKEALDKLASPLVAGIYGADPEKLSLKDTFPRFIEMERKHGSLIRAFLKAMKSASRKKAEKNRLSYFLSFRNGMQQLPEGILKSLKRTSVHTSTEVTKLEKADSVVYLFDIEKRKKAYGAVVITAPAFIASEILPDALSEAKSLLREIKYSSVATVNLIYRNSELKEPPVGHGFLAARGEDLGISAATFMTNKWPFRAPDGYTVIRTFIGGGNKSYLAYLSEEELINMSIRDLRKVMPVLAAEPEECVVSRFLDSMPQYEPGHQRRLNRIFSDLRNASGIFLAGSAYGGIGIPDCMKNAFETAREVADYLKERFGL